MGVMGTFCQICAMSVQHDCYIPTEKRGVAMLFIYRGNPVELEWRDAPALEFNFAAEHAWLKDAVALRLSENQLLQSIEGEVHDGILGSGNAVEGWVMEGLDSRAALHRACWELSKHQEYSAIAHIATSSEWQALKQYHQQLFNFRGLAEDGLAWMLADPMLDHPESRKNRERIQNLLK